MIFSIKDIPYPLQHHSTTNYGLLTGILLCQLIGLKPLKATFVNDTFFS